MERFRRALSKGTVFVLYAPSCFGEKSAQKFVRGFVLYFSNLVSVTRCNIFLFTSSSDYNVVLILR